MGLSVGENQSVFQNCLVHHSSQKTMAEPSDSSLAFFSKGTPKQWEFVYELRKDVIRLKADQRSSKKGGPEEFIKLDNW